MPCDLVDTGILGKPPVVPDISSAEVAEMGGVDLKAIQFGKEGQRYKSGRCSGYEPGATDMSEKLIKEGKCDTVFGMGGSGGSNMLSAAMKTLPLGLPKLLVSTMMSGDVRGYVGGSDMAMMYSVTDIAGLNNFSRLILANAAHAAAGMALNREKALEKSGKKEKPIVAVSMFGITTPGVLHIRDLLEAKGFDTIVFHATGAGGMAMESMIRSGYIDGVIDYTTSELCDYEYDGAFSAGPDRLTAAGEKKIPQVIVPGAIEVLNFNGEAAVPPEKNVPERKMIVHNATVAAVKATRKSWRILAGFWRKGRKSGKSDRGAAPAWRA